MTKEKTKKCECGKLIHKTSKHCYSCNIRSQIPKIPDDFDIHREEVLVTENVIIDMLNFVGYESSSRQKISKRREFLFPCVECKSEYRTRIGREEKKKNKWTCQSCATSKEWKNKEYRERHILEIKKTKSTAESKNRHSIAQKKKYEDPEFKKKMIEAVKETWRRPGYRERVKNSIKSRWAKNPPKNYSKKFEIVKKDGEKITVKSSYERDFVRFLDDLSDYKWEYEPRSFVLKTLENRVYIPDFYIKDLDLWVEVKGYFWKDAKEKWEAFIKENQELNTTLIFKEDLRGLLVEDRKIEDYL